MHYVGCMNSALLATNNTLEMMAARLAATTGAPIEVSRRGLREAIAMLAVAGGAELAAVDAFTGPHGFLIRRK